MRLLPPVVMMVVAVSAAGHNAFPQNSMLAGELRLEGRVEKIEAGRLVIAANAFVNPNGKRGQISPAKTKIIALPKTGTPSGLKVGDNVAVIGRDGGAGKALVARQIIRLKVPVVSTPPGPGPTSTGPIPVPVPGTVTSSQGGAGLLQFDGKTPLQWKTKNLEVSLEKAGFDYTARFLPSNYSALEKAPVFYSIFQIRGIGQEKVGNPLVIRRLLGEKGEFVKPNGLDLQELESQGETKRVVFWSSKVDPSWQFVDMDLDTVYGNDSSGKADAELVIENLTLPAEGEAPIRAEVVSKYGTRYRAIKIVATEDKHWRLVVSHERAATPSDLEITSFSYQGDTVSGGGGLTNGNSAKGENELFLAPPPGVTQIKNLVIRMHEQSRSQEKRDEVLRQRVRFPLSALLKQAPPAPPEKPLPVLGQGQNEGVTARIESQGLIWGQDDVGGLIFAKGTADDAKRGVRWLFQKGTIRFPGRDETRELSIMSGDFSPLWHVDATPKAPDESVQFVLLSAPQGVTKADAEIQLEGRAMLTTSFERRIDLPIGDGVVETTDDGENTLTLRKMQRYSRPEDLANYPEWIRGGWPNSGIALVFAGNPLLGDSDMLPRCLDAEDDQGRPIKTGVVLNDALYQIDVTSKENGPLYSLVLGEPAPDAKFIRVWLSTEEKGRAIRQQTLQLKDVTIDAAPLRQR